MDASLRAFARELGLLFQIVDDILDVEGSEADLGKAVGADARRGKVTYVSSHGIEGARRLAGEAHSRALAALADLPGPPRTSWASPISRSRRRHWMPPAVGGGCGARASVGIRFARRTRYDPHPPPFQERHRAQPPAIASSSGWPPTSSRSG